MDLPVIPNPEETMSDLGWLLPDIYRAFEHGVFKARNHFDVEEIRFDVSAFSTLVRLHAKDYLRKKGIETVEIEEISLCGLSLKLKKYFIKMWKSDDAELPVPGQSEPRKEFYQQPLMFPADGDDPVFHPVHLAVLWNLDLLKNLSALWLACPKSATYNSAEAWWCKQILNPALGIAPSPEPIQPGDLDMQRKSATEKKSEIS